jgi:hypothetical protein
MNDDNKNQDESDDDSQLERALDLKPKSRRITVSTKAKRILTEEVIEDKRERMKKINEARSAKVADKKKAALEIKIKKEEERAIYFEKKDELDALKKTVGKVKKQTVIPIVSVSAVEKEEVIVDVAVEEDCVKLTKKEYNELLAAKKEIPIKKEKKEKVQKVPKPEKAVRQTNEVVHQFIPKSNVFSFRIL